MAAPTHTTKVSTQDVLRSFLKGAVDVAGLYTVCSTLADPTWLVVDPRTIADNDCEATNARHLQPLRTTSRVSHVVIPILHGHGRWTIAIAALRERQIKSFQPRNQEDLYARSFDTARQLCSRTQSAVPEQRWLEEQSVCSHSSVWSEDDGSFADDGSFVDDGSFADDGISAIVYVLDNFLGNPVRKVVLPAWRYTLAFTYAAIEGISDSIPMPLPYEARASRRTKDKFEIVQEQAKRLVQLQRYLQKHEAVLDACITLQARLGDVLQRNGVRHSQKDEATAVLEPGVSQIQPAPTETDGNILEDSRICLLEDVKDALRKWQEEYETFMRPYSRRQQVLTDEIHARTKRRRTS